MEGLQVWEQVLSTLNGLLALPQSATFEHPDIDAAEQFLGHTVVGMDTPSMAEWEVLVRDAQVPARLGKAACKLYRKDIHSQAASIATRSVLRLLDQARYAHILRSQSDSTSTGAIPLSLALKQQLLDSGLVEQLPLLLRTAAQHMRALDGQHTSSSSDSSSEGSESSSWGVLQRPICVTQDACVTYRLYATLCENWPHADPTKASQEFNTIVGVHGILPLAQLSFAAMQHLSRQLGQLECNSQTVQMPHGIFANLTKAANPGASTVGVLAVNMLGRLSPNSAQHKELSAQLMRSTEYLQCIALQMVLMNLTPTVERAAAVAAPAAAAAADGYQQSQQAWQLACSLEDQVPACCTAMLDLLGCSSRAALWVAQAPYLRAGTMLADAAVAYKLSNTPSIDDAAQQLLSTLPHSLTSNPPALRQLLREQHALHAQLMVLFLHAAAQEPSSSQEYPTLVCASVSGYGQAGHECVTYQEAIEKVTRGINRTSTGATSAEQDLQQPEVPATVALEAQKLQQQLLGELLFLRRAKLEAAVAGNSSHAGSNAQERSYINNLEVAINAVGTYMGQHVVSFVLRAFEKARKGNGRQGSSTAEGAGAACTDAGVLSVAAAARVCGQVCGVLEDNVRLWLELVALGHEVAANNLAVCVVSQLLHPRQAVHLPSGAVREGGTNTGAIWEPILAAGPGSKQQRSQLFGLCCSTLKICSDIHTLLSPQHLASSSPPPPDSALGRNLTRAVCLTATQVLKAAIGNTDTTPFVLRQVGRGHWSTGPITVTNMSQLTSDGTSVSMRAVGLLPWLALVGRCYMLWGVELQSLVSKGFGIAPLGLPHNAAARPAREAAAARRAAVEMFQGFRDLAVGAAVSIREVLEFQGYSAALTALGYDIQGVAERMSREVIPVVIRALQVLDNSAADSPAVGQALADVSVGVGSNGLTYANLAFANACNNPACSNVSGLSEAELIVGGSRRCSACRTARYCGSACQKAHWKMHKPVCKALAAAAASGSRGA